MLRTCVDYLMLEDFNWPETIPDDEGVGGEMSQDHQKMWQDHRKMWQDPGKMSQFDFHGRDCPAAVSSLNGLTEAPVPPNTDPFGAFFHYVTCCWTAHLGGAPVDFNLDDVFELASPTSGRHKVWMLESLLSSLVPRLFTNDET